MSYPYKNDGHGFNYDMHNAAMGIHEVVHPHQVSGDSFLGSKGISNSPASSSSTSRRAETFVPMNIQRGHRDGSWTVLFQANAERNSMSIPLHECIYPSGGMRLKDAQEIMFPTLDRNQARVFNLIIAWPGYDTLEYPIDIGTNEAPITRGGLARQIAYQFFGFFTQCNNGMLTQKSDFKWKVGGPDGYSFNQMNLSTFWNVEGTSWSASVRVLTVV
ncbi:hypothetical protein DEU56DRAFT_803414 [Suillus clintonianus]|uniref:uncharacterized protein n=1 Tax=Suillus clintonianus TaxID=1904413 RepID=UPI001B867177|nr:uncharacterized protein DEU56DRAFT_803414 [Suillus clintonianus]KAG2137969.1 hypothetical protein DEU56DRAFT_803414 [Suillus clintonianus]